MLYKKHFLAMVAVLFGLTANAQDKQVVPGLRGKRLFVEGNFSCLPLLVNGPTLENGGRVRYQPLNNSNFSGIPVSWRAGILVHYITKRKESVYGGLEHFQTGLSTEVYTKSKNLVSGNIPIDYHYLFMNLTANIITLGIESNTRSGMLAPIGSYFRFNVQGYLLQGKILDKYTKYGNGKNSLSVQGNNTGLGLDNVTSWDAAFGMELGTRTVIAKNTTLNIGLRTTISAMWLARRSNSSPNSQSSVTEYYAQSSEEEAQAYNRILFQEAARLRNAVHDLLMINVGIGYAIR